jgi:hypothetical protein
MRNGVIARLRSMRRWLVQAVVLALLLPAVIGALPQPALSAAAALDRDLATSVCGSKLPQQQGGQHDQAHDHCVLCATHCAVASPSLASATAAFSATPRAAGVPRAETAEAMAPSLQALLDASPPRGPPALA